MSSVRLLAEGCALVDCGPLYATISVSGKGKPLSDVALDGARHALTIFETLVRFLPTIRRKAVTLVPADAYPKIVNEMISAALIVEDPDFTPLAAVAGATSDLVADYLTRSRATKIIVDNGGDIAIRTLEGEDVTVGLCLDLDKRQVDYSLPVRRNCGVCTSGAGGRSFSLGVADAVVVLADRASVADSAATYLGNLTNVDSERVIRAWSEEIYPETDIPGKRVTVSVGDLSESEILDALESGRQEALRLMGKRIIHGAAICVKGNVLTLGIFERDMKRISKGNRPSGFSFAPLKGKKELTGF